jgi:DNA-binding MarR family transcriptional regulator
MHIHLFAMEAMRETPPALDPPALDPMDCNCHALQQAARQATQFYGRYLAQEGLRAGQFSILSKLKRLGPLPISELAAATAMDRTTMSRAVLPLKRDRLVAIGAGDDGRARVVRLTPTGEARLAAAAARWREAQRDFEESLGPPVAANLREALSRVASLG